MKILVLLLFISVVYTSDVKCPYDAEYNGRCLQNIDVFSDHGNAHWLCIDKLGPCAHLPLISDDEENALLRELVPEDTWLQYQANGTDWLDDNFQPPYYTNWGYREPLLSKTGYCAMMSRNAFWYSQECNLKVIVTCQYDMACINNKATVLPTKATTTKKPLPSTVTPTRPPHIEYPTCVQNYLHYNPCSPGFTYYPPSCKCYAVLSNVNVSNATTTCSQYGGTLASVHNWGEAAFIWGLCDDVKSNWVSTGTSRDNILIGLSDDGVSAGSISWSDGSPFDFFAGLAPGEPSNQGSTGQIILNRPQGYATYIKMGDCVSQTCRYAVCQMKV